MQYKNQAAKTATSQKKKSSFKASADDALQLAADINVGSSSDSDPMAFSEEEDDDDSSDEELDKARSGDKYK